MRLTAEELFKISIIICHHTGNLIYRCLESLANIQAQVIVVTTDPNFVKPTNRVSTLHLVPYLNSPTFKRNQGAILAKGKYITFLDDDVTLGKNFFGRDCIGEMAKYLDEHDNVGMVYATLYKADNDMVIDTSGSYLTRTGFLYETYLRRRFNDTKPILSGKSACCMVRKELFDKIGGFDEDFIIYGEETDLSWRIWLAGYKIMVLPSAIAYHAAETALKPSNYYNQRFIHYHGCKNYITMLIKNLPANKLYIVLINTFIWFITSCCLWFKSKQGAQWIRQGIYYNITELKHTWAKRRIIQKNADHSTAKLYYKNPPLKYYLGRLKDYITHQLHC